MAYAKSLAIIEAIQATKNRQALDDLTQAAIRCARIRTNWSLWSEAERAPSLHSRVAAHNALIESCDILSRTMHQTGENNSWRGEPGQESHW